MLPYFGEQTCEVEISCDDNIPGSYKKLNAYITQNEMPKDLILHDLVF